MRFDRSTWIVGVLCLSWSCLSLEALAQQQGPEPEPRPIEAPAEMAPGRPGEESHQPPEQEPRPGESQGACGLGFEVVLPCAFMMAWRSKRARRAAEGDVELGPRPSP